MLTTREQIEALYGANLVGASARIAEYHDIRHSGTLVPENRRSRYGENARTVFEQLVEGVTTQDGEGGVGGKFLPHDFVRVAEIQGLNREEIIALAKLNEQRIRRLVEEEKVRAMKEANEVTRLIATSSNYAARVEEDKLKFEREKIEQEIKAMPFAQQLAARTPDNASARGYLNRDVVFSLWTKAETPNDRRTLLNWLECVCRITPSERDKWDDLLKITGIQDKVTSWQELKNKIS